MQQEKFDLYLNGRLEIWANWQIYPRVYPPITLLAVMLEVGNLSRSFSGSKVPAGVINDLAEEANTWVNWLKLYNPSYADAINAYYIERRKGKKMRDLAKDRKISTRTLEQRLKEARNWLSGLVHAHVNDSLFKENNSRVSL